MQNMKAIIIGSVAVLALHGGVKAQGTSVQKTKELPKGWHLLDKEKDGVYGISVAKAYEFLKGRPAKPVVVAVIDGGTDTLHEDLKAILWKNPKEIAGNGIDDDNNGYVDDIYGWNFLGGKDGRNVDKDSYEGARLYHKYKAKFDAADFDSAKLNSDEKEMYLMWLDAKKAIEGDATGGADLIVLKRSLDVVKKNDSTLKVAMAKDEYSGNDLNAFAPSTPEASRAKAGLLYFFKANNMMETTNKQFIGEFQEYLEGEERKQEGITKAPVAYRADIVKDNEDDINDKNYGNNDVMANNPVHGTHVAGIIAAVRNNNIGMDGVADNVRIMTLRVVPDGDEHDKDIALAIRYAADNGARVINMSFGKSFSPQKKWIDEAVAYAATKNVLLVHAAGNDAKNLDSASNFPNPTLKAQKIKAPNWITVGASSDLQAESYKSYTASFSNYGKNEVDVFAPGTKIYATVPGSKYQNLQGTSMASPVVAGVAALLISRFPDLSATQIKYAIEKSTVKINEKVKVPGTDEKATLADISKSGGFVNAYEAAKIAASLKPGKTTLPPSTLKKSKKG
jgi:cell wall-associated protease